LLLVLLGALTRVPGLFSDHILFHQIIVDVTFISVAKELAFIVAFMCGAYYHDRLSFHLRLLFFSLQRFLQSVQAFGLFRVRRLVSELVFDRELEQ